MPARVTSSAGTPILEKKKPCTAPMATAARMPISTASHSLTPWRTASTEESAAVTPATEPSDRSISPSSSTKTTPVAIRPGPAIHLVMLVRLSALRKEPVFHWKMAAMMIRPTTTGSEPSSPLRSLRPNSSR